MTDSIDDSEITIALLMMKEEGCKDYIVRETIRWRNLNGNCCGEVKQGCEGGKLEDLETMADDELDGWGELVIDGGWKFS